MNETIVAIASGLINQPIGIIRLSGPDAHTIVERIFSGRRGEANTITYGNIVAHERIVDEVLVAWFYAPRSFTGEDSAEINCHGGTVVLREVLELCLNAGARLAERGEFSHRAFLNGKMDLVKAEAIHDLITAKSPSQARLAVSKFDGDTTVLISTLIQELLTLIATIETNIDYPEYEDVEVLTRDTLLPRLEGVKIKVEQVLHASKDARLIHEGIKVAILGRPNAGKSSLLNALLKEEKALVSSTAGTTRDIVEGSLLINDVLFKLLDTAGIRHKARGVELQGITKAKAVAENADLIIHVRDATKIVHADDQAIRRLAKNKIYLPVWNKIDLVKRRKPGITISAKKKDFAALYSALVKTLPSLNLEDEHILVNSRQLALISDALALVSEAIKNLRLKHEPSTVIVDITAAWIKLSSILGRADETNLLDAMFKNFCLGK